MFNEIKIEREYAGRKFVLETGKVARQADGAVMVRHGDTVLLCTAVASKTAKEGVDFFPLTCEYKEKYYAAGKIPGGFFKREGRPTESEVLNSRLIDRPIRPLFPENFYNEVQVICTVLSYDADAEPDIAAVIGASAALALSGVPFSEPVGAARVGYVDGKYVLNPSREQLVESDLDLVVAGTTSSVLMVESEANILSEEIMLGAVKFGHEAMQLTIEMITELKKKAGKPDWVLVKVDNSKLEKRIKDLAASDLRAAYGEIDKQTRAGKLDEIRKSVLKTIEEENASDDDAVFDSNLVKKIVKNLEKDIVRGDIIKNKKRIDGRGEQDIRNIVSEIDVLPKTHGSSLFTRGETQALVVTTLGTAQDMQIVDALDAEVKEKFMLHYNFPPFSVGETGFLRGPGRREIGHGKLAYRALQAVLPDDDFPYTIRVVSEITESNGSSSMATVCGSSLSMMDAGVPLKAPVAGIAMGLILEKDGYSVLSDILGDEDHLGDMDFKVAGTTEGVTALQMDIKINGITVEIMEKALEQAKKGRIHILGEMAKAITESRSAISERAPQITTYKIPKDKIGELIGPGGKNIREICEVSGAKIDIEEDGTVKIASLNKEQADTALKMVQDVVCEPELGAIYNGRVVKLIEYGAIVNFLGKTDGMVHISEIKEERIENIEDVVAEGQEVKVKVIGADRGKYRLSMKRVNQESGEDISEQFGEVAELAPRKRDRDRDGNRSSSRNGNSRRDSGSRDRGDRRDNRDSRDNNRAGGNGRSERSGGGNGRENRDNRDRGDSAGNEKKAKRFF